MEATGLKPLGRERFWLGMLLAPTAFGLVFGTFGSILATLVISLTDWDLLTPPKWIGLANYIQLMTDDTFWLALRHSLIYLIVTPTLIFLSILLAIAVNRNLRGIHIFRALYYLPAVSGSIAVGITWRWLFDTQGGLLNGVLIWLGVLKEPIQWLAEPGYTLPIAMLLTVWMGLGYYMMIFLAGLQNIPEELYDAALIESPVNTTRSGDSRFTASTTRSNSRACNAPAYIVGVESLGRGSRRAFARRPEQPAGKRLLYTEPIGASTSHYRGEIQACQTERRN